ncbi:MAG: hypothetical protein IJT56_00895 [Clostridia bacterium]|nr:hypothetical protein [Clostridia bacterium]
MINIGKRREVFWDDYLTDTQKTTAEKRLHEPVRRELALLHDEPWEGDCCDYHNFFRDADGRYRMYYLGWSFVPGFKIKVCCAESADGISWTKPKLGLRSFGGSKDNNIILDETDGTFDNFMVFRDPNQPEGSDELYKAVASQTLDGVNALWCYISPDGYRFTRDREITRLGMFDTLNTAFWDRHSGRYFAYIRGFHKRRGEEGLAADFSVDVRDIRVLTSPDFRVWTEPSLLDFGEGEDYPLYTNVAQVYERADHIFVGFPSRYVERPSWNGSFERLCGREKRLERMKSSPRYGLTVTDCVFMCSRDGFSWYRPDEAFMRPGPEEPYNWVYGDCYPARGLVVSPGSYPGTDDELSIFSFTNHWSGTPAQLWRNTIRLDGFISRHSGYKESMVVTKPFVYDGSALRINFSTSARGYMYFTLRASDGASVSSGEIFGDKTDRIVDFENGSPADLRGREAVMEIRMSDADIYSFRFE